MFRKAALLLAGVVFGGVAFFGATQQSLLTSGSANAQAIDTYGQLDLFGQIFERILADYVDEKTDAELVRAAIEGMVQTLDPHSEYYTPEQFHAFQADLSGQFGGLGIEVNMEDNGLVHVVTPIDGTPAAEAGVIAGDYITGIDGEPVLGMTIDEAVSLMRGEPGTDVTITIQRAGVEEPFDITITRAIIRNPQVRAQVFDDIAYIRLTVFGTRSQEEFTAAISDLIAEIGPDVSGFILDLRNNGGGSFDTAIAIADDFLDRGEIVSTRGRTAEDNQRYNAREGDLIDGRPLIVLVNGGSASASEIVAGALQDLRRATIVGTTSYGKGSVQTIFPLGAGADLGAIRLTTALWYTPSGQPIQDVGVTPDIVVEQPLPQAMLDRIGDEVPMDENGDPITTFNVIPLDPEEDAQLQFALQLLRGEVDDPAFPPTAQAETAP